MWGTSVLFFLFKEVRILTNETRGKLLKTAGWFAVSVGLCMIGIGGMYRDDHIVTTRPEDDNIIDVEYTEVEV